MRTIPVLSVLALSAATLLAQNPPIKMGLWEKKMVMTYTGQPRNINSKSCVTPANWNEMVANAGKQHEGCTQNTVKNPHGYTFTAACTIYGAVLDMQGQLTIQDSEHVVSEVHSTSTHNGQKQASDSHSTMRLLSADCGAVKPGEPEIEDIQGPPRTR